MATDRRITKLRTIAANRQAGLVVVLEDIHDPHNAAAVLRTCDALGIQEVYFIFDQEKPFNPRRVGKVTSASANKWLTCYTSRSTAQTLRTLKKRGYETIATVADIQAENIFTATLTAKKIAVLIGNEHHGLSAYAITHANRLITIPMLGMVQSLNLSVTAAILLYEISRQRHKNKNRYRLSPQAAQVVFKNFKKR